MQAFSSWNEFETIYEWVAEDVLEIKNAVPESNNSGNEQEVILKKHAPVFAPIQFEKEHIVHTAEYDSSPLFGDDFAGKPRSGYITHFSPPPDIA